MAAGKVKSVAILLAAIGLLLAACAGEEPPPPTRIAAEVAAVPDLNLDPSGRPSPVVLRLYELKATTAFNNADFFALLDREAATLEDDLVDRQELNLLPGDRQRIDRELDPGTRFIGVIAAYRDLDRATWRAVTEVPAHQTTNLTILLDPLAVSIERK